MISPRLSAWHLGSLIYLTSEWDLYQFGVPHRSRRIVKLSPERYRRLFEVAEGLRIMGEMMKDPDNPKGRQLVELHQRLKRE